MHCVFVAMHRLSLVAAGGDYSLVVALELLSAVASLVEAPALELRLSSCDTQA